MLEIIQTVVILLVGGLILYKEHPKLNFKKGSKERIALLDSCALIDGRIVEIAKTGFVPQNLAVPEFIVAELQLLADGSDSHKRERARFGLEVVQQLQQESAINLSIERTHVQASNTDDKLVKLAKKINADLITTDFNLNQVASIEGVKVLNVNELTHALRPVALPGEDFEVKVLQSGSNKDQGVGYLEDGTMIVIDNAYKDIGKKVKVQITRTHQTVAGKMLFAQKVSSPRPAGPSYRQAPSSSMVSKIVPRRPDHKSGGRSAPYANPRQPKLNHPGANKREATLFNAVDEADKRLRGQ